MIILCSYTDSFTSSTVRMPEEGFKGEHVCLEKDFCLHPVGS